MNGGIVALAIVGIVVYCLYVVAKNEQKRLDAMTPDERKKYRAELRRDTASKTFGPINAAMVCPYCKAEGRIRTMRVKRKKGISGAKATAFILTGVSIFATGLSRKEDLTQAHCENCKNTWDF